MKLGWTQEQKLLDHSLRRFLAAEYGFAHRARNASTPQGWSQTAWRQLAELGVLAASLDERHGGQSEGPCTTLIVMEALGGALVLEPMLASAVLGARALQLAGSRSQQDSLLPRAGRGELVLAWAHEDPGPGEAHIGQPVTARRERGQWLLTGCKPMVLHGADADVLVVSARWDGRCVLFLVAGDAQDLTHTRLRLHDGTPVSRVHLNDTPAEPLGAFEASAAAIDGVLAHGIAAAAAEAVGAMDAALEITLAYLRTREQFGRRIGEYQALQHRVAEMYVAIEQSRSMALLAAHVLPEAAAGESRRDLSRVQAVVGRSSRMVGQQAIQLHGAIGLTEEYPVGHYYRRLEVLDRLFGRKVQA